MLQLCLKFMLLKRVKWYINLQEAYVYEAITILTDHRITTARRGNIVVSAKDCVKELLNVSNKYKPSYLKGLLKQTFS